MNGVGIGTAVGLGVMIGGISTAPNPPVVECVGAFVFYALLTGGLFELYRWAFTWKHPFSR